MCGRKDRNSELIFGLVFGQVPENGETSSGAGAQPSTGPNGEEKRQNNDYYRDQPWILCGPEAQLRPPRQHSHIIVDLRADAEGLKLGSVKDGDGVGDVAGLLDVEECVHERLEGGRVFEMDGDDAAAAGDVVRRLDALDDGIGRATGSEATGFSVIVRAEPCVP